MPIFDLKCKDCGKVFEFLKIKSDDMAVCPECGAQGENKLIKQPPTKMNFQLKGKGWYKDGY